MQILKKIASIFLRVGVSVILLIFLFRQVDKKSLFEIIRHSDKPLLFLAAAVFFVSYLLCLFRWEMLLKAIDIRLPLRRVITSFSGGVFFSLFLPSTIGGDFMRSFDLAAHTGRPRQVVATVLIDRLSGYCGLVTMALLAVAFYPELLRDKTVFLSLSIICGILLAILLVLFNRFAYSKVNQLLDSPSAGRIREAIRALHQELHYFRNHKKVLAYNLILSFFVQVANPLTFYFIALSLGIRINIIYFFVFLPIIGAIALLPISIGGLGLRDATTIFFFAKVGVSKDLAFAMSLSSFVFILIYGALGGLIYVLTIRHRRLQPDQSPPIPPHA